MFICLFIYQSLKLEECKPQIIGHRGAAGLSPENTLQSIKVAGSLGLNFVEVDVRMTSDGIIVLYHDQDLSRMTNGEGQIRNKPWSYIKELFIEGKTLDSLRVPSFEEVLEVIQTENFTLVIEIKDPKLYPGIALKLLESVNKYKCSEKVIFTSFDQNILKSINKISPKARIGYLTFFPRMPDISPDKLEFIAFHWSTAFTTPWLKNKIRKNKVDLWVWTINNPSVSKHLCKHGINGFITDRPDKLIPIFK
jgi:glycerophosphoryl diester phosphodiesterase